jgi:hypothetical protein
MAFAFLRCVGWSVIKNACAELIRCVPFGEAAHGVFRDAMNGWKQAKAAEPERRAELQALAQAPPEQVRAQAEQVAAAVAPAEARPALVAYLQQIPAVARRSLTRRDDPTGRTVPAALPLNEPSDIVPFLPAPAALPRGAAVAARRRS